MAACIALVSDTGEVAAAWAFSGLLAHWSRKHTKAAYVPSQCRKEPARQYAYGDKVRLAQRTDSLRLLRALSAGAVYYDPGIKLEHASTGPVVKRRSQFRVASKNIAALYETVETVEVWRIQRQDAKTPRRRERRPPAANGTSSNCVSAPLRLCVKRDA